MRSTSPCLCFQSRKEQTFAKSKSLANLASFLKQNKSSSEGKIIHNYMIQHGHDQVTFLANCVIEMYGNCGNVLDARAVFERLEKANIYSWNLMIRAYVHNDHLEDARVLFNRTPNPDVYTWNTFLKACVKNGNLEEARRVFDLMPSHNVISWTAMVAAYAHAGHGKDALAFFHKMHMEGVTADKLTFLRALDACSNSVSHNEGQEIHAAIVEGGLDEDIEIVTALVRMYGKCSCIVDANTIFVQKQKKDVICWTALMTACSQNECYKEVLHLYLQMQCTQLEADNFTFVCVLDACSGLVLSQEGKMVHAAAVENGCDQNAVMQSALINFYGKCGTLEDLRMTFWSKSYQDVVSWNAMISALIDSDCSKDSLVLFWQMQFQDVKPDNITFICTLNACGALFCLEEGQEIHCAIIEHCFEIDIMIMNSLINMYGKCRSLENVKNIFNSITYRDTITYNILISVHMRNGLVKESLDIFWDMQQTSTNPDKITFTYVIDACGTVADFEKGYLIHWDIVESGHAEDTMIISALIKMYGKCRCLDDSVSIFEKMVDVDIVSWTALIGAVHDNECSEIALDLYERMQGKGIKPDNTCFVCALDACASLAALEKGEGIHALVLDNGFEGNMILTNALIDMYGKCGSLHKAQTVFANSSQRSVSTWNAMIAALANNGSGVEALEHFSQMQCKDVEPDSITFISILTACSHSGWIDNGVKYFILMNTEYYIPYIKEHYACMIDMFGRTGRLDVAESIAKKFCVENADVAWLSLLGACRIHGDYERAVHAAEQLFKLDPKNPTPYVLLSNMFAATNTCNFLGHC